MSERKENLSIDGGQANKDDHVASYKLIPESETDYQAKSNLTKSKEKLSPDGAEEKLLQKEEEAKIVTRVDMADAKYIVGDHRNGDTKIELDANKKFSGLTKEELLKYADDPFWVNLRWAMFVLFWAMWLCMLAGAVAIIVQAPKCAPPPPRTWFEKGPLVDVEEFSFAETEETLPALKATGVEGIFIDVPTYEALDNPSVVEEFKNFVTKAKEFGVKVIVDLTPNFVSSEHPWFAKSENRTGEYESFFIWAPAKEYLDNEPKPPNNWVSTLNASAWSWSPQREEFYLHQYAEDQPDLNFNNPNVVEQFDNVVKIWMTAGAHGIRLMKARQLLVNTSLADEEAATGRGSALGAGHAAYGYWRHRHTSDQPKLDSLFARWAGLVQDTASSDEWVFTAAEEGGRPELYLLQRNTSALRPPSAAPRALPAALPAAGGALQALVADLNAALDVWPFLQLKDGDDSDVELATFALLLPATPVLGLDSINYTASETLSHLVGLRSEPSVAHGARRLLALPAGNHTLLACARWKTKHTGYVAVYNPSAQEQRANLSTVPSVPATVALHHMSHAVKLYTNYSSSFVEQSDNVLVPPRSTVVLSYVPVGVDD